MRELGVDPVCAARQYTRQIEAGLAGEHTDKFDDAHGAYAGPHSWANCSTTASRLAASLGLGTRASFGQRCEAVVDASAVEPDIAVTLPGRASGFEVSADEFLSEWKQIVCQPQAGLPLREALMSATINGIDIHGELINAWTPPTSSICYEAVMLGVARAFLQEDTWIRVAYC